MPSKHTLTSDYADCVLAIQVWKVLAGAGRGCQKILDLRLLAAWHNPHNGSEILAATSCGAARGAVYVGHSHRSKL